MTDTDKSPVSKGRGFSTDFNDHVRLVHQLAKTAYGRISNSSVTRMEYDDVFQEMCLAFVKAQKTYDPSYGFTFTAYAGRAMKNAIYGRNRVLDKQVKEFEALKPISVEDMHGGSNASETYEDPYERLEVGLNAMMDSCEPIESRLERAQLIRGLSPWSRLVCREVISPSEDLLKHHAARMAHVAEGEKHGIDQSYIPRKPSLKYILDFYKIPPAESKKIRKEFMKVFGIKV